MGSLEPVINSRPLESSSNTIEVSRSLKVTYRKASVLLFLGPYIVFQRLDPNFAFIATPLNHKPQNEPIFCWHQTIIKWAGGNPYVTEEAYFTAEALRQMIQSIDMMETDTCNRRFVVYSLSEASRWTGETDWLLVTITNLCEKHLWYHSPRVSFVIWTISHLSSHSLP